jgi:hypothetical protein
VPAAAVASSADATIYSQTGLNVQIGSASTAGAVQTLNITGAGGATVGVLAGERSLGFIVGGGGLISLSWAALAIGNGGGTARADFRFVTQTNSPNSTWYAGLPVNANATWNNPGRTAGEFIGNSVFITTFDAAYIGFGINRPGALNADPQGVGNTGKTWYLLFQFTDGAASGDYGWISFTANVVGFGNSSITITGWGWDDSGATIGAGVTASVIPGGTGLAALACGAIGLRGRRRSRVA